MFIYYAILILVVFLLEILSIICSELSAVDNFSPKKKNQIVPLNVTTMFRLDNVTHTTCPPQKIHNSYSTLLRFYSSEFRGTQYNIDHTTCSLSVCWSQVDDDG